MKKKREAIVLDSKLRGDTVVKLQKMIADKGPGIFNAFIYHDDDCPALLGGVCSCDPDLEITEDIQ